MWEMNGGEWLEAIHGYYGELDATLPLIVAFEMLGKDVCSNSVLAASIVARGIRIGDDMQSSTTEADVADAKQELIEIGFLKPMFACELDDEWAEQVLEFRLPA